MRKLAITSIAILAMAALAWASDVWKKPYQQWSKKDVIKILADSPWAKSTRIAATWERNDNGMPMSNPQVQQPQMGGQQPGSRPGAMGGSPGVSSGPPNGGMQGMQPGGTPMAVYIIRWVSARTIREALVRDAELNGQMNESQAKAELSGSPSAYEILVAGPDMLPFEQTTEDAVKKECYLEVKKSKQRIEPLKVEFQRSPDGQKVRDVVISFPKTANGQPTIGPDAKGADFSVSLARARIHASFDFSKMSDAQGRDL